MYSRASLGVIRSDISQSSSEGIEGSAAAAVVDAMGAVGIAGVEAAVAEAITAPTEATVGSFDCPDGFMEVTLLFYPRERVLGAQLVSRITPKIRIGVR